MTELGCNYSPQLMKLLADGEVDVDWIKLSRLSTVEREIALCRPTKPLLLHTLPHASMDTSRIGEWHGVNEQVERCSSPHIALHLAAQPDDCEDAAGEERKLVDKLLDGVLAWKRHIRTELLIENVPYYGFRGTLRAACEPDVIASICERADVGLLLDTAHLRVAAFHMGMAPEHYLRQLPLDRVREIHVCGPAPDPEDGYLRDRHLEMQDVDYALLDRALSMTRPRMVTLEYGGTGPKFEWRSDPDALKRQLLTLRRMLPA